MRTRSPSEDHLFHTLQAADAPFRNRMRPNRDDATPDDLQPDFVPHVDVPEPEPEQEQGNPNPPAPKRKHQDTRWVSPPNPASSQIDNDTICPPHLEMSVDEDGHVDYEQFSEQEELMRYFDYISSYSAESFPFVKIENIPTRQVFDDIKAKLDDIYDGIFLTHEDPFPSTRVRYKKTGEGTYAAVVNSALIVTNLQVRNSSRNVTTPSNPSASSSSNTQTNRRIIHRSSDQM
jgi:hypothetical protein